MKFYLFLILFLASFNINSSAQIVGRLDSLEKNLINPFEPDEKIDAILFEVSSSVFLGKALSFNQEKFLSRGFTFGYQKDIRIVTHQLSFASGLLLSIHNFKNDLAYSTSKNSNNFNNKLLDSVDYQINKLRIIYLEVPLEFRYRTKPNLTNRSFKVFAGMKIGYQLAANHIFKTENFKENTEIKELNKFRLGPSLKIGYGNILFSTFYSLSQITENKKLNTFTAGIAFFIL